MFIFAVVLLLLASITFFLGANMVLPFPRILRMMTSPVMSFVLK